ncbi:MAG: ComF family protein [Abditibacteriota bacterium]|nr:ComF family protein [Abditibacteriota bacterium]
MPQLLSALHYLRDHIFFPTHCAVCGRTSQSPVCPDCEKYLDFIEPPCCELCSGTLRGGDGNICASCAALRPRFVRLTSAAAYNAATARIVKRAKYAGAYMYVDYMAEQIDRRCFFPRGAELVTCVPMHLKERLTRTYDHNLLLGKLVARRRGLDFESLFDKVSFSKNQASIGGEDRERIANIAGTFRVRPGVSGTLKGKKIVVCDDVTTSGATMNELARLLSEEGARVWCVTFANSGYAPRHGHILLL